MRFDLKQPSLLSKEFGKTLKPSTSKFKERVTFKTPDFTKTTKRAPSKQVQVASQLPSTDEDARDRRSRPAGLTVSSWTSSKP